MANLNLTQEKLEALRSEYKYRNVRGKYPRQKMLPEYTSIYPWVLPDEEDPYFAFCTICECRLGAKRSDLGKHEGSIKHTENAVKKGVEGSALVLRGCQSGASGQTGQELRQNGAESAASTSASASQDEDEEGDEAAHVQSVGNDDDGLYIKQEPVIDLVENSSGELNLGQLSPNSDDDDGEEEEDDDDGCDYASYVPPLKRRASDTLESHSQHSGTVDYLPMPITVDASPLQRFSIREIPSTSVTTYSKPTVSQSGGVAQIHYGPQAPLNNLPPAQAPCKITIKKITAPMPTTATATQVPASAALAAVPASITISHQPKQQAPATITALPTSTLITQQPTQTPSQPTQTCHSTATVALPTVAHTLGQTSQPQVRDSFDLFFDSICASVKALPPKLATEGKIRVMQLIGELEMRAITEREECSANQGNAAGQQSATVASTTK